MLRRSLLVAALVCSGAAQAEPSLCAAVLDGQLGPGLPQAAACQTAKGLGGVSVQHCAIGFAYRQAEATALYTQLASTLDACFAESTPEPGVNHPDTYDQRQYTTGKGVVSVSLKDKAALAETYVFVRLERR